MKLRLPEKIATGIHLFNGIGGMAGGLAAITDPVAPMGVPAATTLVNSPFTDFFIPGILLFAVIGLGNLLAAISFFAKWKLRAWISGFFASALVIWIVVQCIMLQAVAALHVIFFVIGAVQGLLALYTLTSRK